jgi:tetratricopeptide (TPR) repeat protein
MSDEKDKAEEIFKNLVAVKPDYYPAHYNLGNIYFDKKLYLEALAEFTRVKEIKPDHRMARLKIEEIKKLVSKNE